MPFVLHFPRTKIEGPVGGCSDRFAGICRWRRHRNQQKPAEDFRANANTRLTSGPHPAQQKGGRTAVDLLSYAQTALNSSCGPLKTKIWHFAISAVVFHRIIKYMRLNIDRDVRPVANGFLN